MEAIRRARPTTDFQLSPLGPRIRQFLWEVCCKARSSASAFAGPGPRLRLLGILAFALITINHLAAGFGAAVSVARLRLRPFLFRFRGRLGRLVAVSIAGLSVRRFIVRPMWLGKVSPESGVIALLIFILMVTYLAGLRLDETARRAA